MAKKFKDLTEQEILALAVSLEEEDGRIYGEFAEILRSNFPSTAELLLEMQKEESSHRTMLLDLYRSRFGDYIPHIKRTDVKGFVTRPSIWLSGQVSPSSVRRTVDSMEKETGRLYQLALERTTDAPTRRLLGDLAEAEAKHSAAAELLEREQAEAGAHASEEVIARKLFVLQYVQPGLVGLMDGSVSTLAPLFAAAFATQKSHDAFVVGLAASVGAGISMAFAEALSDDGSITGRGSPWLRGLITGLMTTVGGIGHTLPYLLGNFHVATIVAFFVVVIELAVISWIRQHYMDSPWFRAALQVVLGGALVFTAGILIGQS